MSTVSTAACHTVPSKKDAASSAERTNIALTRTGEEPKTDLTSAPSKAVFAHLDACTITIVEVILLLATPTPELAWSVYTMNTAKITIMEKAAWVISLAEKRKAILELLPLPL